MVLSCVCVCVWTMAKLSRLQFRTVLFWDKQLIYSIALCVCELCLSAQSHLMHHWHLSHHIHLGPVLLWNQTNLLSAQTWLKVMGGCTDRYRCLWVL